MSATMTTTPELEIAHILRYFAHDHLQGRLQEVAQDFCLLAHLTAERAPGNHETAVALRKLLEAKDAAVRAVLS